MKGLDKGLEASQSQPVVSLHGREGQPPRLLDLFCCAGGAATGYAEAGFEVVGVDVAPSPRYPFAFIQADATALEPSFLRSFDAIHASPPCQAHSKAQRLQGREHPDLVGITRRMLRQSGRPYVIENVEGAPLIEPVLLCGSMFGLRTYRHRLFETNWLLIPPPHPAHDVPTTKMGRRPKDGEHMHIVGNFSGVDQAREIMAMPWANRRELAEAIPPAFTRFIGGHLIRQTERIAA